MRDVSVVVVVVVVVVLVVFRAGRRGLVPA
jgi:hypothetical protein